MTRPTIFQALLGAALATTSACSSEPIDPGQSDVPVVLENATLTPVSEALDGFRATALAFNPNQAGELWITLQQPSSDAPCTEDTGLGCDALVGVMAIVKDGKTIFKEDGNAWHFMRRPTSVAFGANGNLATCGDARTDNYQDDPVDYSGPVLWSSDPRIFGARPSANQNGTHIDMLHETPYCMGIAFERDNVYWAFNGRDGALDRCDFKQPHQVGGEDHSDGEVRRYLSGYLLRVPEVPSHLALDAASGRLYAVDSGHARVLALEIASGTHDGEVEALDPIAVHWNMTGATFSEFVPAGVLQVPSGIALTNDRVWITDNADGRLYAFDRTGKLRRLLDTGLGSGTLAGVALDPTGALYVSDLTSGRAYAVTAP